MKKRCIYCFKEFDDQASEVCPFCHKSNKKELDDKEIHELHQNCHNNIRDNSSLKDGALTYLVIGSILLIIGAIFLFLSYRYNVLKIRVFTPNCTEFVISIICLCASLYFLSFGIVRLVKSLKRIRFFEKVISETELKEKR
jgi:hypothetical protein